MHDIQSDYSELNLYVKCQCLYNITHDQLNMFGVAIVVSWIVSTSNYNLNKVVNYIALISIICFSSEKKGLKFTFSWIFTNEKF